MNVVAASEAPVLILRKILDAEKSQARALVEVLPPPPSPRSGLLVDVYA